MSARLSLGSFSEDLARTPGPARYGAPSNDSFLKRNPQEQCFLLDAARQTKATTIAALYYSERQNRSARVFFAYAAQFFIFWILENNARSTRSRADLNFQPIRLVNQAQVF